MRVHVCVCVRVRSLPYFEQDLATFLLVRGPYAWIGYVWSGCTDSGYPRGCDPNCNPTGPADDQVRVRVRVSVGLGLALGVG